MSDKKPIRTRFAPSPTGYLHVGGVRSAIFAWLAAKSTGGSFILRLEDTDRERLVPDGVKCIVESFRWLGMEIDEGPSVEELKKGGYYWEGAPSFSGPHAPYIQSMRLPRYKEVAEELVAKGFAYRCDCTQERLEEERQGQMARKEPPGYSGYCRDRNVSADSKHVIRFKIPRNERIVLSDIVRGEIVWDSPSLRDTVILKSDGYPTYHLAALVDDYDMGVNCVLRGEEWIPTTPIHISIYKALGWEIPMFGHLPQVLGNDGKKLGKRHGATSMDMFMEGGYLPEALFNFLALIGWAPGEGEEQEIFSKEELVQKFSVNNISSAGGVLNYDKLNWMNGVYIRALPADDLCRRIKPYVEKAGLKVDDRKLELITPHIQERMALLTEAPGLVDFLFQDEVNHDIKAMLHKGVDALKAIAILQRAKEVLSNLKSFEVKDVEGAIRALPDEFSLPMGPVFIVIRIGVTGKKVTPPLFESISILGQEMSIKRIESAIKKLS